MSANFSEVLVILAIVALGIKAAAYFAAEAAHLPLATRRAIAIKAVSTQAIVLGIFVAFGPNIIEFFHVSIAALEVAGGLILLKFAVGLVLGESHGSSEGTPRGGAEMAIYPLAVPLLASPQAIVAITIFSAQMGVGNRLTLWEAFAVIIVANFVILVGLAQFMGRGGETKSSGGGVAAILLRVVALLLAAFAIEIIALGLRGYGVLEPLAAAAH